MGQRHESRTNRSRIIGELSSVRMGDMIGDVTLSETGAVIRRGCAPAVT